MTEFSGKLEHWDIAKMGPPDNSPEGLAEKAAYDELMAVYAVVISLEHDLSRRRNLMALRDDLSEENK